MANTSGMVNISEIIEDEVLLIKHSGEIPEIAFHGCLHYLTEDPEGPRLGKLPDEIMGPLVSAVIERYRFITLRDLEPRNRDKRIYRGVARSIVNWNRLKLFASRFDVDISEIKSEVGEALARFLDRELEDVLSHRRNTAINCTFSSLESFAERLDIDISDMKERLRDICPATEEY
jgi:hypothetical protein